MEDFALMMDSKYETWICNAFKLSWENCICTRNIDRFKKKRYFVKPCHEFTRRKTFLLILRFRVNILVTSSGFEPYSCNEFFLSYKRLPQENTITILTLKIFLKFCTILLKKILITMVETSLLHNNTVIIQKTLSEWLHSHTKKGG